MSDVTRREFLGGMVVGAAAAGVVPALLPFESEAVGSPLNDQMAGDDAWAAFLGPMDLMWTTMPTIWYDGPFLGNGNLGTILYQPSGTGVQLQVGHSWVQEHRPQLGPVWGLARLMVGHLTLQPVGSITGINWREDLWNAQVYGTITTSSGSLSIQVIVHDQKDVMAVKVTPSGGETGFRWVYTPDPALSPRSSSRPLPAGYVPNPSPQMTSSGSVQLAIQPMVGGGQTTTAWQDVSQSDGSHILYLSVAHSFPDTGAQSTATALVQGSVGETWDDFQNTHRSGWHAFFKKSFVSVPDARLQAFYWIQLFKMNCVSRANSPILSTSGPWQQMSEHWPNPWWDANVQTEYWILQTSNHQEIDSLSAVFSTPQAQQNLINGVPPAYQSDSAGIWRESGGMAETPAIYLPGQTIHPPWESTVGMEVGDLPFGLSNVWLTYMHTLDDNLGRNTLFPLLRRSINYYLHFLTKTGSTYHLPSTYNPESVYVADCPYDIVNLRWGCLTLIDLANRLGINDPLIPKWQDVAANLPSNPNLQQAIYPMAIINWDQGSAAQAAIKAQAGSGGNGFHMAWGSTIASYSMNGDLALSTLQNLVSTLIHHATQYAEAGTSPVIESPLAAADCLHSMFLQSWNDIIRVFPACPTSWSNVVFHNWRAWGNFLVSAVRSGGKTQFVRVLSQSGAPCRLRLGMGASIASQSSTGRQLNITQIDAQTIQVDLQQGEEAVFYPAGSSPTFTIAALPTASYRWGINTGGPGPNPPPSPNPSQPHLPGAPVNVTAAGGTGQAQVSWSPPGDSGGGQVTAYAVFIYPQLAVNPVQIATTTGLTVSGLASNTYYTFTVTAWNGAFWGPWSNWSPWTLVN